LSAREAPDPGRHHVGTPGDIISECPGDFVGIRILDGKSPGQPPKLNDIQRQALARMIESGPIPAVHGVVRWRLIDLAQWIFEEFRITIAKQTLSRELRSLGYRKLSARPRHHAQAAGAIEDFKKASPPVWRRSRARRASTATR